MSETNPNQCAEFVPSLDSADIPPREKAKTVGIFDRIRAREEKKVNEQINQTIKISTELDSAIKRTFPKMAVVEQEKTRIENNLRAPIESYGELSGSADRPLFIYLAGQELPAVYKPASRANEYQQSYAAETSPFREWLAAQIDRALGLGIVPITIVRSGPQGVGSVQEWIVGKTVNRVDIKKINQEDLLRVAFFDFIAGAFERHPQNLMEKTDDGRHIRAIDNVSIFSEIPETDGRHSVALDAVANETVPEALRESTAAFRASAPIQVALRQAFVLALGNHAQAAWKSFINHLEIICPTDKTKKSIFPKC